MKNEPHMPTFLGIFLLLFGVGGGILLVETGPRIFSQAKSNPAPEEVTVANITDASFAVSWITEVPLTGAVKFRQQGLLSDLHIAGDIRDALNQQFPRYIHYVDVSNLRPETTYEAYLVSGNS